MSVRFFVTFTHFYSSWTAHMDVHNTGAAHVSAACRCLTLLITGFKSLYFYIVSLFCILVLYLCYFQRLTLRKSKQTFCCSCIFMLFMCIGQSTSLHCPVYVCVRLVGLCLCRILATRGRSL